MNTMKTWDGKQWRDTKPGDDDLPGVMVVGAFEGKGSIDPAIPIVTGSDSVEVVKKMHERFAGTGGD